MNFNDLDDGRSPDGAGLSQQAAEPEVSALRASIPSACPHCGCTTFGHFRDWNFGEPGGEFKPRLKREGFMCRNCEWVAAQETPAPGFESDETKAIIALALSTPRRKPRRARDRNP